MVKKLLATGKIQRFEAMQVVTQVSEMNSDTQEERQVALTDPIPSMLHHFDKTDLASYSLEHIFESYDDEVAAQGVNEKQRFAPQLTKASKYKTTNDVVQAAKTTFKETYMKN